MPILQVIPAGDLVIEKSRLVIATGHRFMRQKIACRFRMFLGEWFLDRREGVPYYRDVFKKNPDLSVIRSVFRRVLLSTSGVQDVPTFTLFFDAPNRELSFEFEATLIDGETLHVTPADRLFIIDA